MQMQTVSSVGRPRFALLLAVGQLTVPCVSQNQAIGAYVDLDDMFHPRGPTDSRNTTATIWHRWDREAPQRASRLAREAKRLVVLSVTLLAVHSATILQLDVGLLAL